MSANHTPGPWSAELSEPFTLGGDCREVVALDSDGLVHKGICTFMLDTDEHPDGKAFLQDVANAQLLAAAPELLQACEETLNELRAWNGESEFESGSQIKDLADMLKAAITKAGGAT